MSRIFYFFQDCHGRVEVFAVHAEQNTCMTILEGDFVDEFDINSILRQPLKDLSNIPIS